MSAAHGFCFQRRSPHVSAHVASPCSHAMQELADSRRSARFGKPVDRDQGVVFPSRRSIGVPLMLRRPRASSVERIVHRRRPAILRSQVETRGPRPTPPSRVNGCSWCCSGPKHLLAPSAVVRIGDPIRPLGMSRPLRDATSRGVRELLPCQPTHEAQRVPPILAVCLRAPFETRHCERCERLRFRNRPSTGGAVPPRLSLLPALLRILADPLFLRTRARSSRSPPTSSAPTPPSSTDDLQGWVVPSVSPADPDLAVRCLSLS